MELIKKRLHWQNCSCCKNRKCLCFTFPLSVFSPCIWCHFQINIKRTTHVIMFPLQCIIDHTCCQDYYMCSIWIWKAERCNVIHDTCKTHWLKLNYSSFMYRSLFMQLMGKLRLSSSGFVQQIYSINNISHITSMNDNTKPTQTCSIHNTLRQHWRLLQVMIKN